MTSFDATKIVQNNDGHHFQTFKIQGKVYRQIELILSNKPDCEMSVFDFI